MLPLIITRVFYICTHIFDENIAFFYTKFKDTWFCIIYLELDLFVKTLREGMSQLFINDDFALKY